MRFDVVVVGSGFGGAVMAQRVASALGDRASIGLFDKGGDPSGQFDPEADGGPLNAHGNRFRHTLDPRYLSQLAEVFTDPESATFNVLAGTSIGGGSNVYAAVSLRAPTRAFARTRAGRALWPARYTRAGLDPQYARVESKLRVGSLGWTDADRPHWQLATKRDYVFAEGCRRIGATALPLKLASDQDDNEGWWSSGQRFSGRQSLTKNYLLEARDLGVTFHSGCEVQRIQADGEGYRLEVIDRRHDRHQPFEVSCRMLVVAAGAVASTALLLRSKPGLTGLDVHDQLGRHLSGNGDYGVTGVVGSEFRVEGHKGKPIGSYCPSFFDAHGFILLPFYAEPLYLALNRISTLNRAAEPQATGRRSTTITTDDNGETEADWGPAYKARLASFAARHLSMGCLAFDDSEGEIELVEDRPVVRWRRTSAETEARWSEALRTMGRIYEALGGEMFLDNYRLDGSVNSSHPLGGCSMAEEAAHGVVDPHGECFGRRNLFVVDGSIIPSSLCANPSLTIAAVAESIADRLLTGDGTESLASRLGL